jgi:hypothetical protein
MREVPFPANAIKLVARGNALLHNSVKSASIPAKRNAAPATLGSNAGFQKLLNEKLIGYAKDAADEVDDEAFNLSQSRPQSPTSSASSVHSKSEMLYCQVNQEDENKEGAGTDDDVPAATTDAVPAATTAADDSSDKAGQAKALKPAKATVSPRNVSKRLTEDGKPWTQKQLSDAVSKFNSQLPAKMRHKYVKNMDVPQLDAILDNVEQQVALAGLRTLQEGALCRLTQAVHRSVCIRILTILAKDPVLLDWYKDSISGTHRLQLEGGNDTTQHPGTGMGLNHAYHHKLNEAFHDITNCGDFPYDYIPGSERNSVFVNIL